MTRHSSAQIIDLADTWMQLRPGEEAISTGWEYHDRKRDTYGRFTARRNTAQVHIRITPEQAAFLRDKCLANRSETGTYIWRILEGYYAMYDAFGDQLTTLPDGTREIHGISLPH